jgi:hypothetical protein
VEGGWSHVRHEKNDTFAFDSVDGIMADAPIPDTLIRASVQGVVYLIHSPTGGVYTYNVEAPTYIGQLERIPEDDKHLMSKQNGCLHYAKVQYREDIKDVMASLRRRPAP